MKGVMLTFKPFATEPEALALSAPPSLAVLEQAVGGSIEIVPWFDTIELEGVVRRCVAYRNEDGKLNGEPINDRATELWEQALRQASSPNHRAPQLYDVLVGTVVTIMGDRELMEAL
jgi:Domain of unknown function (DUF3846)